MNYLKNARNNYKSKHPEATQEWVAEKLFIHINTVKNFEKTDSISKELLHKLIVLYEMSQEEANILILNLFGLKTHNLDINTMFDPNSSCNNISTGQISNINDVFQYINNIKVFKNLNGKTSLKNTIICFDDSEEFRKIFKFVDYDAISFYSLYNSNFSPVKINIWKIPKGIIPQLWIQKVIELYTRIFNFRENEQAIFTDCVYELYEETGVFDAFDKEDWRSSNEVRECSGKVNFKTIYERMNKKKEYYSTCSGKINYNVINIHNNVLNKLLPFSWKWSIEFKLYGSSEGIGFDELIFLKKIIIFEYNNDILINEVIKQLTLTYCAMFLQSKIPIIVFDKTKTSKNQFENILYCFSVDRTSNNSFSPEELSNIDLHSILKKKYKNVVIAKAQSEEGKAQLGKDCLAHREKKKNKKSKTKIIQIYC